MRTDLTALFHPQNIAIVGVSQEMHKLGTVILHNLIDSNYEGELFLLNPKHDELFGRKVYKSLLDIGVPVDLVVIAIPAKFVLDTVKEVGNIKAKNCIIISAGFSEMGEAGREIESEIITILTEAGCNLVGPNCLGVISSASNMNASFAAQMPKSGNIAFLSQSGAVNTALLDLSSSHGLGFADFVSLGNKGGVDEIELIKYWESDAKVKVIGAYLEDFEDGRELYNVLSDCKKPVVILRSGESQAAQRAIASHTGSIASQSLVVRSAISQSGQLQVHSIEKLFNTMMILSWSPSMYGKRVAIITNAGGPSIMTTDLLIEQGLEVPVPSEKLQEKLRSVLPAEASVGNPIDLLGDADSARYRAALDILQSSDEFDCVVVLLTPQHVTDVEGCAKVVCMADLQFSLPIVPIFIGGGGVESAHDMMREKMIPSFQFAEEAAYAIGALAKYSANVRSKHRVNEKLMNSVINENLAVDALTEKEVFTLATKYSIPTPMQTVVTTLEECMSFMRSGKKYVIKATTLDAAHKSESKLIYLNLDSASMADAFKKLHESLLQISKTMIPQILIQEMHSGTELFLGMHRDSSVLEGKERGFGPVMVFGSGGIYTEIMQDTALKLLPLDEDGVLEMIHETKVSKIINGARGQDKLDMRALVQLILNTQKLLIENPRILSLDINPLFISKEGVNAADLKIFGHQV